MTTTKATTSPTPTQPGRWVIPHFGPPSVLTWQPFDNALPEDYNHTKRLYSLPSHPPGNLAVIRIITAGIAGPDNAQRVGAYPNPNTTTPGFTPGYDFVGEILALGPEAQKAYQEDIGDSSAILAVGDHVTSMCAIGAHATHIVIAATELFKLRKSDDPVKMVALPLNYTTGYGMLRHADVDLKPGSSILVGSVAGGCGTAVAQLVKTYDMGINVIGTCSPANFDYVRSLGVTPFDPEDPELVPKVRAATPNGQGVDVAYDFAGSVESFKASTAATKDGKVICMGIMDMLKPDGSGLKHEPAEVFGIVMQRLGDKIPLWRADHNYAKSPLRTVWRSDLEDMFQKVREGKLDPYICKLLPLRDEVQAQEMLASGKGVQGKMVFVVDAELAKEKLGYA